MLHLALTCDFSCCSTCKRKTAVPVLGWSEVGLTNSKTDILRGVPNLWDTALLWKYLHTTIPVNVNNFSTRLHRGKKVTETRVKHSILLVIEECYLSSFPQLWGGVKRGVNPKGLLPFPDLLWKKKKIQFVTFALLRKRERSSQQSNKKSGYATCMLNYSWLPPNI